jgi:uncharacterized protein involved in type VI secretion and phage assembly
MPSERENGIVIGVVTDLNDPEGLARVRVKFPHLNDEPSDWARLSTPMAGKGRGLFFRPEVDDEVLVAFEHGEPRRPYIVGALWSKVDTPPPDDGNATQNNWRQLVSRSGHVIRFDDTNGAEKIEIIDKDKSRKVVLDSGQGKIQVTCDQGDVEVTASSGTVKVQAVTVDIQASGNMTLHASGTMTISGATVNIN